MLDGLRAFEGRFRQDHQHPVNRWLHYIGQPLVGVGLLLLFFDWRWGVLCILSGYALMWAGHFLFEGNLPGILQNPGYIVVASLAAISVLTRGLTGLIRFLSPRALTDGPDLRQRARGQFESWKQFYGGALAQRCFFRPTHRFLCERLPRGAGLKVLDVGCGSGRLLAMLPAYLPEVERHGVDLAGGVLQQAQEALGPGVTLLQADSQHLPYPDDFFDVVLCSHSFHHYPDQLAVVREMRRLLRPGGQAFILDGDRDDALGWLLYDVFIRLCEGPVHHATAREMRNVFASAGFAEVDQAWQDDFPPVLLTSGVAGS